MRLDLFDDFDVKSVARARADEEVGRARTRLAEMEIPADHDRADAEALDQHLFDEFLRRQSGQGGVEGQEHRAVEPERLQARAP